MVIEMIETEMKEFLFDYCVLVCVVNLFCAGLDIKTKFPYFLFLPWLSKIRNQEFRLYI